MLRAVSEATPVKDIAEDGLLRRGRFRYNAMKGAARVCSRSGSLWDFNGNFDIEERHGGEG